MPDVGTFSSAMAARTVALLFSSSSPDLCYFSPLSSLIYTSVLILLLYFLCHLFFLFSSSSCLSASLPFSLLLAIRVMTLAKKWLLQKARLFYQMA